jgi:hypothetical protein
LKLQFLLIIENQGCNDRCQGVIREKLFAWGNPAVRRFEYAGFKIREYIGSRNHKLIEARLQWYDYIE